MKFSLLIDHFLTHLPFNCVWMIRRLVDDPETVLDLGCGRGELMVSVKGQKWKITGVDIFEKDLNVARKTGVYDELIKGDLIKFCEKMVKEGKRYDLVFASGIIEHLTRKNGIKILDLSEKLARKRIYFGTPRDYMNQPKEYYLGNSYQRHRSGWSIEDFTLRGYRVYGVGFFPIWSEDGFARSHNVFVSWLLRVISYVLAPVTFWIPSLGSGIMAIKIKRD